MIGLKKRDIKKALKAGAKAGSVSFADVRADIEATIDEAMNSTLWLIVVIVGMQFIGPILYFLLGKEDS